MHQKKAVSTNHMRAKHWFIALIFAFALVQFTPALADNADKLRHSIILKSNTDACNGGNMKACVEAGDIHLAGQWVPKSISKAINLYRYACDRDEALGCSALAAQYYRGTYLEKNFNSAKKYAQLACDLNGVDEGGNGCTILALLYYEGRSVTKNQTTAALLFKQACKKQNALACSNLAGLYNEGIGVKKSEAEAFHYARIGCEQENNDACAFLIQGLADKLKKDFPFEGSPANMDDAQYLFGTACRQNNALGCFGMATVFDIQNRNLQAGDYYRKACSGGHMLACYKLGLNKRKHVYSNTSKADALPYFKKACTGGIARSCLMLGELHTQYDYFLNSPYPNKEEGVTGSDTEAVRFFDKACQASDGESCYKLGVHYFNGVGVAKSLEKAAQLFQRACDEGLYGTGCSYAAYVYNAAVGVQKNATKEAFYNLKACHSGIARSCKKVRRNN